MKFKADLHLHSSVSSDGEIEPEALVRMAAEAGMGCVAVTDHNRTHGVGRAVAAGKSAGVVVIPAIEIDCDFGDAHLHVLGYGIDHAAPGFEELWRQVHESEAAAANGVIDNVEAMGIRVDRDKVWGMARDGVVIVEYVAEVALADSRNDGNPILEPFRPGGARSDNPLVNFYWDLCGRGKPGHVAVESISLGECVGLITATGGVPVLAHPGQSLKEHQGLLPEIAGAGVRGVEAYSSYHSPEQCAFWREQARESALFVTCGSDFHGKMKPAIPIGGHGAGDDVQELLEPFFAALT